LYFPSLLSDCQLGDWNDVWHIKTLVSVIPKSFLPEPVERGKQGAVGTS